MDKSTPIQIDPFHELRRDFLGHVARVQLAAGPPRLRPSLIVITHLLPDRPALLTVLGRYFNILRVFGIPYSTDPRVSAWTGLHFPLSEPTLEELLEGKCIESAVLSSAAKRVLLLDIGGYATTLFRLGGKAAAEALFAVVEGTESGFQRYSKEGSLSCPVVCLSLSPLKAAESALVGPSCLYSVNRILRINGFANEVRTAAVLGYGRVGASVAGACKSQGLQVAIFDSLPERRVRALADGFLIPERGAALARADLIVAATGQRSWTEDDSQTTQDGAFLVSCSSKDVEFDFASLKRRYPVEEEGPSLHTVTIRNRRFHFVHEGAPANFIDGANLGPVLPLLQAELIGACGDLLRLRFARGVQEPRADTRSSIVAAWLKTYVDKQSGWYKIRTLPQASRV